MRAGTGKGDRKWGTAGKGHETPGCPLSGCATSQESLGPSMPWFPCLFHREGGGSFN